MTGRCLMVFTVAVVAIGLAACTADEVPGRPTPIASAAPVGAPVVCGVGVADVERTTGRTVATSQDRIVAHEGVGAGVCEVFSNESDGELFVVQMYPLDDPEARAVRAALDGSSPSTWSAPQVRLDAEGLDGGLWGVGSTPTADGYGKRGLWAFTFWGETMLQVYLQQSAPWRTGVDELVAMTFQVAGSYGLDRSAAYR